ncbi:amphi-Trp domain-containing protein [Streptomyces exfoliatus]|uniref:amphi-Trp domain-containing protein n=1 Tax=Streptomyces exfoliatus TaxID=1905 RepID=UPI003C2CFA11
MKDLKFEQKRALSRLEAADQLAALAAALRQGGEVEMDFGLGTLSLQIPDDLRGEVEVEIGGGEVELEIGGGEVELEIEFKWPTGPTRRAPSEAAETEKAADTKKAAGTEKKAAPRKRKSAPAKPGRNGAGAGTRAARGGTGGTGAKKTDTPAKQPAPKKP